MKSIMKIFNRIKSVIKLLTLDIKASNTLDDFASEYNIIEEMVQKNGLINPSGGGGGWWTLLLAMVFLNPAH